MSTEVVLWEAGGNKLVPIIYDSNIFNNYIELLIVDKIILGNENGGKRIKFTGRNVSFSHHGAVVAKVGAVVAGSIWYNDPFVGMPDQYAMIAGYVAENEMFKWETTRGDITINNVKILMEDPCGRFESEIVDCVMKYYTDLLNIGVDIENGNKEYEPGDVLGLKITALMLASVREKLASIIH